MKDRIILFSDRVTEYSLYSLIFFLPFAKAGIEICFTIALFAWMLKRLLANRLTEFFPLTELNRPLLAFVLANVVAVIMSINFKASVKPFFFKFFENIFIFFIVVDTINTKKRIRNLLGVVIFSSLLICVDAGVQYLKGVDFLRGYSKTTDQRLMASFGTPVSFAAWLIMIIFIILGLLLFRQPKKSSFSRFGLGVLLLSLLACMGLTYSRGAWIGLLVGLIIFAGYKIIGLAKKKRGIVILWTVVFAIVIFLLLPHAIRERIGSIGDIDDSTFRLKLWPEALSIIEDFPLFGAGLNNYMAVSSNYSSPAGGQGLFYPHNSYLQMAAEIGMVGLICFLWLLFRFFVLSFRALLRTDRQLGGVLLGLLAGIAAFLVHSFFDNHLYSLQLMVLLWFMMGLAVAVIRIEADGSQ